MVAAGMIWTSRVHGDRYWIDLVVDPSRRREGIGTALFAHLSGLRKDDLAFMTRGYVDEERLAFADALGATTVQVVPPALIDVVGRFALRPYDAVVPGREVPWSRLLEANAATYEWIHASWSPVAEGFAEALNEGLEDDLDLDATSVAVDASGRIRAVAMAYNDVEPPVITAETVVRDEPEGRGWSRHVSGGPSMCSPVGASPRSNSTATSAIRISCRSGPGSIPAAAGSGSSRYLRTSSRTGASRPE
ncbi:hypothetical protein GCM10027613_42960 [Microlunatus endophyticus]